MRHDTPGPAKLGPYRIARRIGQGAMGAVFLARDPRSGRDLAIKTLALGLDAAGSGDAQLRFEREAQAVARLTHPDIVAVVDAGTDGGVSWIAMEVVPGRDLSHHTASEALLPVPVVLRIAARVADALAYAHSRGVLHRDIKPANVMFDPAADTVKVMDFGIARLAGADRTQTGRLPGTPAYLSPEQIAGLPSDGRSDLYALGVTLFHLLCAQLPHQAQSLGALLGQIAHQPAPDIRDLRPELPAALARAVAQALAKRPAERPADGAAMAQALRAITLEP